MKTPYDIEEAFAAIEDELIASMMRNMKRHHVEEIFEKKQWTMWQAEQLKALAKYKKENRKKFGSRFSDINSDIDRIIREANKTGYMEQETEILEAIKKGFHGFRQPPDALQAEFFKLNERKLDALIQATASDMQKAETAILRMADDQYRRAIFNAQVYANTGAGTYEKAVDMATKDMLSSGLNCIEYANGARHTLADYAEMAIRTASKRAYLQGEGTKRQEWGIPTVIMNKRGNPCPKCLPFVGKVLIDDVWSGGPKNGKSPETGVKYPLMSKAIAAGLYHPRCKDSHTTYFEGISTPPDDKYTVDELDQILDDYRKEQKQQYAKRQEEKFKRLVKCSLDPENQEMYQRKGMEWEERADLIRGMRERTERIYDHEPVSIFNVNSKYRNDIVNVINRSPERVRNFINKYHDGIVFINEHAAHNREGINGIRVNLNKDAADSRGKWCGTFHEIGHRVDRLSGRPSENPDFEKALRNDFDNLVKGYQKLYNINRKSAYEEISEAVKGAKYHSISDLFGGMSGNQCVGDYAHRKAGYWDKQGRLGHEAFAHFFEAYSRIDTEKINILKQTFPDAFRMFEKMMEDLE